MPGPMVFLFDLAKDASAFTELESDFSGMQRTGTERHQGRFWVYLFCGDLNKRSSTIPFWFSSPDSSLPPPLNVSYFCKQFPRQLVF